MEAMVVLRISLEAALLVGYIILEDPSIHVLLS
jgi:hypothetical protein